MINGISNPLTWLFTGSMLLIQRSERTKTLQQAFAGPAFLLVCVIVRILSFKTKM